MVKRFERYIYLVTPNVILKIILPFFKKFKFFQETATSSTPITFKMWYRQKVLVNNFDAYWPVHMNSVVINPRNIYCGIETCPGFSPGNYIQAIGKIYIGDYTSIAANVGIVSANHKLNDNREHIPEEVRIGKYCWIGMGSLIMPSVELGDYTVVAAGSVVTKSFIDGYQVIGGNPAKLIKKIKKEDCKHYKSEKEYNGYIKHSEFEIYRKKNLNV